MTFLEITVKSISYGEEKDAVLLCEYTTIDILSAIEGNKQELINTAYKNFYEGKQAGQMQNATKIRQSMKEELDAVVSSAEKKSVRKTATP